LLLEGIERVDGNNMWNNFVKHTMEEEEKFYNIDFIIDDVSVETQSLTMTVGDTSSESEFSSDE